MHPILLERQGKNLQALKTLPPLTQQGKQKIVSSINAKDNQIFFGNEVICRFGGYASFDIGTLKRSLNPEELRFAISEAAKHLHEDDLMSGCFIYGAENAQEMEALKLLVYAVHERSHRYLD